MTIYKAKADSTWDMICYRYSGTDLQRLVINKESGAAAAALAFPGDGAAWQDILPSVASAAQANSFKTEGNKIQIALKVSDVDHPDKKRFADYNVASTYFPRNAATDSLLNQESEEEEELVIAPVPIYGLELMTMMQLLQSQFRDVHVIYKPYNTMEDYKTLKFTSNVYTGLGTISALYKASDYISVAQLAPDLIKITTKEKTPLTHHIRIKVISTKKTSVYDEIKVTVK